jgi:predicted molibdopterin-dependent oxidoreductase YjgC
MCDHGRLDTFQHVNSIKRIDETYVRRAGQLQSVSWDEALKVTAESLKDYKGNEIAFIGSAYTSCEDNFAMLRFAKSIGVTNFAFLTHVVLGDKDDILINEDKTPNTLGAELVGVKNAGLSLAAIQKGIMEGKIKALYVIEDDIASFNTDIEQAINKLELLIVHATNLNKTTKLADIVFPVSTYAEKNGTYVNFLGRLQRIRPAVATEEMDRALDGMEMSRWDKFGTKFDRWMQGHKYNSRASWKIFSSLSALLGGKLKYNMAEEVFTDIANSVEAFHGLDYDEIGDLGVQLKVKNQVTTKVELNA